MPINSNHDINIIYYPPFDSLGELCDQLGRAAWYLSCINPHRIVFPLAAGMAWNHDFHLPDYMDGSLLAAFEHLKDRFTFLPSGNRQELQRELDQSTIVMQWRFTDAIAKKLQRTGTTSRPGKQIWNVDRYRSRFEGSYYIKAGTEKTNYPGMKQALADCRRKFRRMAAQLEGFTKSYLFLTGPTSARFREFDCSDGFSIACNSTIFDDEMMDYFQPKIITIADSIFHFGVSQYAAAFRKKLLAVLERHDVFLCMPFNHYRIFAHHFPAFQHKTIGIPFDYRKPVNLDLNRQFYLNPYKNILLILMLPLAATFSKHIHLVGADGRKRSDNRYFWAFNEKTQIVNKMDNIRAVHPAFFELDYNEYYDEHTATLAGFLHQGEKAGKSFHSLTPSFIPCLRERYTVRGKEYEEPFYPPVSIIMHCRGNGEAIVSTVSSVQAQDYPNWELAVVDETLDTETRAALERTASQDRRIQVISSELRNPAGACNQSLLRTRGEYVAFLTAGDIYHPHTLGRRMDALFLNGCDAVYCPAQLADKNLDRMEWALRTVNGHLTVEELEAADFQISRVIIRKDIVVQNGVFDVHGGPSGNDDLELIRRIIRAGVIIGHVKRVAVDSPHKPAGASPGSIQKHAGPEFTAAGLRYFHRLKALAGKIGPLRKTYHLLRDRWRVQDQDGRSPVSSGRDPAAGKPR